VQSIFPVRPSLSGSVGLKLLWNTGNDGAIICVCIWLLIDGVLLVLFKHKLSLDMAVVVVT